MNKKQVLAAGSAAAISLIIAFPAFAATTETTSSTTKTHHVGKHLGTGAHTGQHTLTNAAFGKIASVNGSSFTITHKTKTGTKTITIGTTSATVFKKSGIADSLMDLAIGQNVVAMGVKDSGGNIAEATSVNIMGTHGAKK